jgi:hypothetical protein
MNHMIVYGLVISRHSGVLLRTFTIYLHSPGTQKTYHMYDVGPRMNEGSLPKRGLKTILIW